MTCYSVKSLTIAIGDIVHATPGVHPNITIARVEREMGERGCYVERMEQRRGYR